MEPTPLFSITDSSDTIIQKLKDAGYIPVTGVILPMIGIMDNDQDISDFIAGVSEAMKDGTIPRNGCYRWEQVFKLDDFADYRGATEAQEDKWNDVGMDDAVRRSGVYWKATGNAQPGCRSILVLTPKE